MNISSGRTALVQSKTKENKFRALSYSQQIRELLGEKLIYPGGWSNAMGALGHKVEDVLIDETSIQKTWWSENDVDHEFEGDGWIVKILSAQIERIKPTILFFQGDTFRLVSATERECLR